MMLVMKKHILKLLFFIVLSETAQARICDDSDRIHKMLPDKTTIKFNQAFVVGKEMGVQFSAGKFIPFSENKALGRSILVLTSDTSFRGSYVFRKIDVQNTHTSADDTPFIFEPLDGQYLEISLYQKRSRYDFRNESYISVGSLKYNLGDFVTLHAECND